MGWHVHYKDGNRVGVRLVADREAALAIASELIADGHEIIRLLTPDGALSFSGEEATSLITAGRSLTDA